MAQLPRVVYVVSHTHWDREWYLPFATFRGMLVKTLDGVLDALENDPAYRHFCLDGQTIVLEDYLAARHEEEGRIRRLVEAGALGIGPWYVLPDEFLIPPEASIRNLVIGHRVASRFGGAQKVGYLPDAFGHPAQTPQLLKRAGIDSFFYTRGDGDDTPDLGLEWMWTAPDGSEVLAVHQLGSYCNGSALGFEEMWHAHTVRRIDPQRAVEQMRRLLTGLGESSNGDVVLVMNGCDHLPVQRDFATIFDAIQEAFPEVDFRHASLSDYADGLKASGVETRSYLGELRGGKRAHVLSGVWSARMPLKQADAEAHGLLADVCEPLAAYAHFVHGQAYPSGLLELAWKELLSNQPHDSICGCSVDEVHREMGPRFDRVVQTTEQVVREGLQSLAPTFGRKAPEDRDTVLALFNALPECRREVLERLVVLQPPGYDLDALRLVGDDGNPVPFEIVERVEGRRFWGVDWRLELWAERQGDRLAAYRECDMLDPTSKDALVDTFLHVRCLAEMPAVGHALLRLVEAPELPMPEVGPEEAVRVENGQLTNGWVTVRLHPDGTFDLTDERSGRCWEGLNVLEDVEDVGDEYDYAPAEHSETISSRGAEGGVEVVDAGSLAGALETCILIDLPAGVETDRKRRRQEHAHLPVCVRVALSVGSPVVDVSVWLENQAEDHRLSAVFPTGLQAEQVVSDAHFWWAERPVEGPSGDDWLQPSPDTVPQQEFTFVTDGSHGLAVLNEGLPEMAALRNTDGSVDLRLTLLRCVGGSRAMTSRRGGTRTPADDPHRTPSASDRTSSGTRCFRFGDALAANVKGWSRRWATPLPCVQGVLAGATPGGGGLFAKSSNDTVLTALKRAEERDTLIVRIYNLSGDPVDEVLDFSREVAGAWGADLLEERQAELRVVGDRRVEVPVGPHEIVTVEIRFP